MQTHRSREIYLGRAHYLMRECQRVLNGETNQTGPLRASFTDVVDVVTLAPSSFTTAEAVSAAKLVLGGTLANGQQLKIMLKDIFLCF